MVSWAVTPCSDLVGYQRSEDLAVSLNRVKMPLRNVDIFPHDRTVSDPEDHDLNLHRRANLKFRVTLAFDSVLQN